MKKYGIGISCVVWLGMVSCVSLSEGTNTNEIVTEPEARVLLEEDRAETIRDRMDEQASEVNRKRNIEEFDRNEPAMTPPDLRPQLVPHAPIDSAVHNNIDWLRPTLFRNRLINVR